MTDNVNHPSHYTQGKVECIDALEAATDALDKQIGGDHYKDLAIQPAEYILKNKIGFCEGNVIKYISRHSSKGGKDDILKAIHYCEMIIQYEYNCK